MRLRDSWLFRFGSAALVAGAALALFGDTPSLGVQLAAVAYLVILVSIYRVGTRVFTRGGIVTKQESPWIYRANFLVMSIFGFGPLCIAISRSLPQSCTSAWGAIQLGAMAVSAAMVIAILAFAFGAAAFSLLASVWRAARNALTPPSSGRL